MKVLSLFDGMSCGRLALQELGIKPEKYFASEIKPYGIKVAKVNFPDIIHIGDVTKVSYKNGILYTENGEYEIGEIDIVIGGSPCQSFSISCIKEKRLGLKGEKSKLFYEYLRILKEVNPKYFLLENVYSMDKDSRSQLDDYMGVDSFMINSEVVTGQIRKRLYWTNIPQTELVKTENIQFQNILEYGYTNRIKSRTLTESMSRPNIVPLKMYHRYVSTGFTSLIFKDEDHHIQCKNHYDKYFKGLSAKAIDEKLDSGNIDVSIYEGLRYLNAVEMERLQGVPEGYTSCVSRNEAASLLGDGWTVPVIAHILKGIKEDL